MNLSRLPKRFDAFDARITGWMARYGVTLARVALGVVFLWFGVIKFVPGWSPAADLATRTIERLSFGLLDSSLALPVLAAWETVIGIGLLTGKFLRATLFLLFLQMIGTVTPLVVFPSETFGAFPHSPTMEGQYIIKNLVLVTAGIVVGATVRGGRLRAEPPGGS